MTEIKDTAAWSFLTRLKQHGVDRLYCNSGTDFAPIIEAYESASGDERQGFPELLTITHETVVAGMAHGAYLVTGNTQAIMVHVHVGLANALMGIINHQSDNIPVLVFAGKTPITEFSKDGARMTPQQSGQDVFDQNGICRQFVKWDSELRHPEQIVDLIDRMIHVSRQHPQGPTMLSLPRETLAGPVPSHRDARLPIAKIESKTTASLPEGLTGALERAKRPLIIIQKTDPSGELAAAVDRLARHHGIAVIEPFALRNVCDSEVPYHFGYQSNKIISSADVLLVIESPCPWIQRFESLEASHIFHIGHDPLWSNLPSRSHAATAFVTGDPVQTVNLIESSLETKEILVEDRLRWIQTERESRREKRSKVIDRHVNDGTMSPALVGDRLARHLTSDTVVFSELGPPQDFAGPRFANQWYTPPFSGGLGWGVPAAIGAKLACPSRRVVACVGDGSFLFANPLSCFHTMNMLHVPILIVVLNNAAWNATRRAAYNMYPGGSAVQNESPVLTDLSPQLPFSAVAEACSVAARQVNMVTEIEDALDWAMETVDSGRSVLLDISTEKTDGF
jgi:acetolactate synthase-1/2/3 large subunit